MKNLLSLFTILIITYGSLLCQSVVVEVQDQTLAEVSSMQLHMAILETPTEFAESHAKQAYKEYRKELSSSKELIDFLSKNNIKFKEYKNGEQSVGAMTRRIIVYSIMLRNSKNAQLLEDYAARMMNIKIDLVDYTFSSTEQHKALYQGLITTARARAALIADAMGQKIIAIEEVYEKENEFTNLVKATSYNLNDFALLGLNRQAINFNEQLIKSKLRISFKTATK